MSILPSFFGRPNRVYEPFSLDSWDPFEGFFPFNAPNTETAAFTNTQMDWKETPETHVFKIDLPGVKKEEVKLEIEEGTFLKISGERAREPEEKGDKWHCIERSSGKFHRRFRLPENAKVDGVMATMENGVLTVTIPKQELMKKTHKKTIEISTPAPKKWNFCKCVSGSD